MDDNNPYEVVQTMESIGQQVRRLQADVVTMQEAMDFIEVEMLSTKEVVTEVRGFANVETAAVCWRGPLRVYLTSIGTGFNCAACDGGKHIPQLRFRPGVPDPVQHNRRARHVRGV